MDPYEFVNVLAEFGSRLLGEDEVVSTFHANNNHESHHSGLLTFRTGLGPTKKGIYPLCLGAFLNSKYAKDQKVDVWFDNVSVLAVY